MTYLAVRAGDVVGPDGRLGPATIVLDGDTIAGIETNGSAATASVDALDARGDVVTAGLIDLHTHGAGGIETCAGSIDALRRLAAAFARHGVTGFLASIGGSDRRIRDSIPALVELIADPAPDGARCLGIHLEGPFISPCCPGAFPAATIVAPDPVLLAEYLALGAGTVRTITLAPEIDGALDVLAVAEQHGVIGSIGHSGADAALVRDLAGRGIRSATHLFNAMPALHHRAPGPVGAALTDDRLVVELIADNVHVDPMMLDLAVRCCGLDRVALVTDSIAVTGLGDGEYATEEQRVIVVDGVARLADGKLAGSTLTLDRAVVNLAEASGRPWDQALACATAVPARLLGRPDRHGQVAAGDAADLVGFDHSGRVRWTMVGGRVVYRASA